MKESSDLKGEAYQNCNNDANEYIVWSQYTENLIFKRYLRIYMMCLDNFKERISLKESMANIRATTIHRLLGELLDKLPSHEKGKKFASALGYASAPGTIGNYHLKAEGQWRDSELSGFLYYSDMYDFNKGNRRIDSEMVVKFARDFLTGSPFEVISEKIPFTLKMNSEVKSNEDKGFEVFFVIDGKEYEVSSYLKKLYKEYDIDESSGSIIALEPWAEESIDIIGAVKK